MIVIAIAMQFVGFGALAMSLDRHFRDVLGGPLPAARRNAFRIAGWGLLGLSLGACLMARGWQFGPVWFLGLVPVTAMFVLIAMTAFRARS